MTVDGKDMIYQGIYNDILKKNGVTNVVINITFYDGVGIPTLYAVPVKGQQPKALMKNKSIKEIFRVVCEKYGLPYKALEAEANHIYDVKHGIPQKKYEEKKQREIQKQNPQGYYQLTHPNWTIDKVNELAYLIGLSGFPHGANHSNEVVSKKILFSPKKGYYESSIYEVAVAGSATIAEFKTLREVADYLIKFTF